MSKYDMQEPQFSDEEIEMFLASLDEHVWKTDNVIPRWLWMGETLAYGESAFQHSQRRKLSPAIKKSFSKLREVVGNIRRAFEKEMIGDVTEKVLRDYYQTVEDEWWSAVDIRDKTLKGIEKRLIEGRKTGHAAFNDNWMSYWDDSWLERRVNNKGWVHSARDIINKLPSHIVLPVESTISRHRKKLYELKRAD